MKATFVTLFTVLLFSTAAYAEQKATCSGPGNLVMTFEITSFERLDSWCGKGLGRFLVHQGNRFLFEAPATWSSCSKSGVVASAKVKNATIHYREAGGLSSITTLGGARTEFTCESNFR